METCGEPQPLTSIRAAGRERWPRPWIFSQLGSLISNPKVATAVYFCPTFLAINYQPSHNSENIDNIQNTRGKGFCIMYLLMFLFFLTAVILMLYNRSGVIDFAH